MSWFTVASAVLWITAGLVIMYLGLRETKSQKKLREAMEKQVWFTEFGSNEPSEERKKQK